MRSLVLVVPAHCCQGQYGVLARRCRDMVLSLVQEARERLLEVEEFLGSFFLVTRALDTVGHVQEPRALELGRRL